MNVVGSLQNKQVNIWFRDPSVLLKNWYHLVPTSSMTMTQKANAITRLALIVTLTIMLTDTEKMNKTYITIAFLSILSLTIFCEKRQVVRRKNEAKQYDYVKNETLDDDVAKEQPQEQYSSNKDTKKNDNSTIEDAGRYIGKPDEDKFVRSMIRPPSNTSEANLSWLAGYSPQDLTAAPLDNEDQSTFVNNIKRSEIKNFS